MSIGFIIIGGIAMPYINNQIHDKAAPLIHYYVLEKETCHIYLMFETLDAFIANNPINVSAQAEPICVEKIRSIRLTFDGANKYFPRSNSDNQTLMDLFSDTINANANILTLINDSQFKSFIYNNQTYSRYTNQLSNLTYAISGSYSVEVQFEFTNGTIQDKSYVIQKAITISAPENVLQIKANNIMIGLGWIGVGAPLVLAGLVLMLEAVRDLVFREKPKGNNQLFSCVNNLNE